jgi:hypothetical protein
MAARRRGRDEPELVDAPPAPDAYTGMLATALVATVLGLVFLYMDWNDYGGKAPPDPKSLAGRSVLTSEPPGTGGGFGGEPTPVEPSKTGGN